MITEIKTYKELHYIDDVDSIKAVYDSIAKGSRAYYSALRRQKYTSYTTIDRELVLVKELWADYQLFLGKEDSKRVKQIEKNLAMGVEHFTEKERNTSDKHFLEYAKFVSRLKYELKIIRACKDLMSDLILTISSLHKEVNEAEQEKQVIKKTLKVEVNPLRTIYRLKCMDAYCIMLAHKEALLAKDYQRLCSLYENETWVLSTDKLPNLYEMRRPRNKLEETKLLLLSYYMYTISEEEEQERGELIRLLDYKTESGYTPTDDDIRECIERAPQCIGRLTIEGVKIYENRRQQDLRQIERQIDRLIK